MRVLVTGGSGFIAAYCMLALLERGYRVRTTVRSRSREADVLAMLRQGGAEPGDHIEFAVADLTSDAGWAEAAADCAYVMHVASPLMLREPAAENDLIGPAREGTLRVLRAAREAGVRRVVLTSSFAAIGYGHDEREAPFTEEDWTDVERAQGAYVRSKAIAERAAWDFMAREGGAMELAAVNPVVVLGPVLSADHSASIELIKAMLEGRLRALPQLTVGIVDVRDVADLHLRAMIDPAAGGKRFLSVAGDFLPLAAIAQILRDGLGKQAARVPVRVLPNWLVRLAGLFSATARQAAGPELGRRRNASNACARMTLGWDPRPPREAVLDTARSLIERGLVSL